MNSVIISGYINWIKYNNSNANEDKNVLTMLIGVYSGNKDKFTGKALRDSIKATAFGHQAKYIYNHFKEGDSIEIMGLLCNRPYFNEKLNKNLDSYYVLVDKAYYCPTNKNSVPNNKIDDPVIASFEEIEGFSEDEVPF